VSDDGGTCSCGSTWFRLEPDPDAGMPEVLVTVDRRGVVMSYTGRPICDDCDTPWVPPRARLRIVSHTPLHQGPKPRIPPSMPGF